MGFDRDLALPPERPDDQWSAPLTLGRPPGQEHILDPPAPIAVVGSVPLDAESMDCWFERHGVATAPCQVWDSRYGANYWFPVARRGPAQPVYPRSGAIPHLDMVNVLSDGAAKRNMFPQPGSGPQSGSDLQTFLMLSVWVRNVAYTKNIWIDVNVYDQVDALIHAESFALVYHGPSGGDGDLFAMDGPVYQGARATPGSVSPQLDARKVQYRLYYEVNGQVFTDAILHQQLVIEDALVA